ncbi:hypothetical protein LCGC14_3080710 [marine sediment metagenome]|uniref:Uncharacterized protein n=1 Tax=marine sediment metagenome TaxID=412755 RepID=A0A0F8X1W6_9ZZZZ
MTEERTSVIEVGMELDVLMGYRMTITEVVVIKHGVFIRASLNGDTAPHHALLPYELPPVERTITGWHGWASRGSMTLPGGAMLGYVCFYEADYRYGPEEHDAQWERTIEAMKAEEGVMQSRPTELRLN